MPITLYPYQEDAVRKLKTGSILCGGVGSGKSRTALAYYYIQQGCSLSKPGQLPDGDMKDLYIITTARKRDTLEWDKELIPFLLSTEEEHNAFPCKVIIDSWNNIKKYKEVFGAFFIFDEDRVTGSGAWVKAFLNIARKNDWIILSATPGDTWSDYIPVFIANGFYKNKTEFTRTHIIYNNFTKYPKIDRYINTGRLNAYRRHILVDMDYRRHTVHHDIDIYTSYDIHMYKGIMRNLWDPFEEKPLENASAVCYALRKVVNSDPSRIAELLNIVQHKDRLIIFYNFDYELEILLKTKYGDDYKVAQWNGHVHEDIPKSKKWIYLVQYGACEGWNCTLTDTIIFYSQNYSYKTMVQASGRIDRLNTPFTDLYYYHFKSRSSIDLAISRALSNKKAFNESKFING